MKKIIMITGGARSGKSSYAEQLALSLSPTPVYLATARVWDEEFRQRVQKHQERRGPEWTNIEEEKELSKHQLAGRVVLIDCITMWCNNFFFDLNDEVDTTLDAMKQEFFPQLYHQAVQKQPHSDQHHLPLHSDYPQKA